MCLQLYKRTGKCSGRKGAVTGPTGPTGTIGQTGSQGATGLPGLGLELKRVDSFDPSGAIEVYIPTSDTSLIHVRLWGAGGGGAGAGQQPNVGTAGSGGGGAGFAEAYITISESQYSYFLAVGGLGGSGPTTGVAAETSWFGNPGFLFADGGDGGGVVGEDQNAGRDISVAGGRGGISGGTIATSASNGSDGSPGATFTNGAFGLTAFRVSGGGGGAAPYSSGTSSDVCTLVSGTGTNGSFGLAYGGGGGGAAAWRLNTPVTGGTGAGAHLIIEAYG
jgi:hypothetical protein